MPRPHILALVGGAGILLLVALASAVVPNPTFRLAIGDLAPLLIIGATFAVSASNASGSRGHTRLFWSLIAAGMGMWCFNQCCWTWYQVVLGRPLPDPSLGDVVLFLHVVPIMAAVGIRPNRSDENEGMLPSGLNMILLLLWWVVFYAFFVFPEEYIVTNLAVYGPRWNLLYFAECMMLVAAAAAAFLNSSGAWREIYRNIFVASAVYTFASEAVHAATAHGIYRPGGVYDPPLLAAALGFLWTAIAGRRWRNATQATAANASSWHPFAPQLGKLALLSLPVFGYWALFFSHDPFYLRQVRFAVAMGGVTLLAFVVFLRQHLLDQRLLQLLTDSRRSFHNQQRLQGQVVQQAKLASLGELVALAAGELEHPLSAILRSSERIAASSHLSREQLATAEKIGGQARRTRELVADLLSFAQQTPGEKTSIDLKPLLQRAAQMEGFKLGNKKIALSVESRGPVPRVPGNPNQLLQAFLQIIENAVDALQQTGGELRVSLWREGDEVIVQFADSGPGLRDPGRVFDPFYTTKPVGKGTGLGLSATYGVILDHKGHISCYNRPEGGAVFEIRLPTWEAALPLAGAAQAF